MQTPVKGVNDLTSEEILGRKLNFMTFIPHGRNLNNHAFWLIIQYVCEWPRHTFLGCTSE